MTPSLMIGWMAQAIVVSSLLAVAAVVLQKLAGRALPARVIWGGALFASLLLVLVAPLRIAPRTVASSADGQVIGELVATRTTAVQGWRASLRSLADGAERVLTAPVRWSVSTVGADLDQLPTLVRGTVAAVWPLSSAIVLLAIGASYRRHRAELQCAALHDIDGVAVSVTNALGPAVIGLRAPRIVVPSWLLERPASEQRLVITHEQSHIAAGDPSLLLAACIAVALMPWNPVAWFTLARLRLAIELDCDHRVLDTGASARQYGQLLIELSSHVPQFMHTGVARTPLALTSPAFSYSASHLERRLITMTSRPSKFIRTRRIGSGLLAAVALLAACESQLPTAAEMERMDVKGVESRVAYVTKIDTATATYTVNGTAVTRAEASALSADRIATVNVLGGSKQRIAITTKDVVARARTADPSDSAIGMLRAKAPGQAPVVLNLSGSPKRQFTGVLIIDGRKVDPSVMSTLNPDAIESVEVMKGDAGKALYGEAGVNGVIVVTTKKK